MATTPFSTSASSNLSNAALVAGAVNSLAGLILVSPSSTVGYQPLNPVTANGLASILGSAPATIVFNYEGEQTALIESDITDHYVETNSAIQDQITLKPEIITTKGYVGELNNILPNFLLPVQAVANGFVTIGAYNPQLSATALNAYQEGLLAYEQAAAAANAAVQAVGSIAGQFTNGIEIAPGSGNFTVGAAFAQNKQQAMFQQFYGYWYNRVLFNIQTPWAVFTNMAILSMKSIQDETTKTFTDFEVTFKKIRYANTQTTEQQVLQDRAATQGADVTNLGTSSGTSSGTPTQGTAIADQ